MKTFGYIILALSLSFGVLLLIFFAAMGFFSKCDGNSGPYYGKNININSDTKDSEYSLTVENGVIEFYHLQDTLPMIVLKRNNNDKIDWAVQMIDEGGNSFKKISDINLIEDYNDKKISFFNGSYGEPAYIRLDNNYNFNCACQLPF